MELVGKPMSISRVVTSTKRIMNPIAETKGIIFSCNLGHLFIGDVLLTEAKWRALVLIGDETRISQLSNNLCNNAIKFTPHGGSVEVRVHLLPKDKMWLLWNDIESRYPDQNFLSLNATDKTNNEELDGSLPPVQLVWHVIEVEDTGCGVQLEDMKVMFNAYKQVSSGVSKTYQGTGLGLHICRLHIDLMGGMLGVASVPGRGTLFMFAVPLICGDPDIDLNEQGEYSYSSSEKSDLDDILNKNEDSNSKRKFPSEFDSSDGQTVPKRLSSNVFRGTKTKATVHAKDAIFIVVDDSTVNLRLTKRKLLIAFEKSIVETNIKYAMDGLEAISLYKELIASNQQKNIAVILMDYHMPKCSGLEAIIEIRSIEKAHNFDPVYIVAFTADVTDTSNRDLTGGGANYVLPKVFTIYLIVLLLFNCN